MRKVISVLLAVLMVFGLFGLVACNNETEPTDTPTTGTPATTQPSGEPATSDAPTTGGDLVIGVSGEMTFIASWMLRSYNDRAQLSLVYEPLVKLDENGDWYCYLLESLEPDPEALTWTCTLRDDVYFSDGSKLDADALLWNFENYKENSNTSSTHFSRVDNFEKVDDSTVVIHLTEWTSQIPYSFQDNCGFMYSKKAFEENGMDWCLAHPVGTGPYVEDEVIQGESRKYVKNENYWNKDATQNFDSVTWVIVANESSAQAALQAGEIHGYFSPSFSMVDTMLSMDGFHWAQNTTTYMIQFMIPPSNVEGSGWEDINVRKAAYHAINTQEMIDSIAYGYAVYSNQYAGPGTPFYNDELVGYEYNLDKAKEYMAQSNYPDGFQTKQYSSTENRPLYEGIGVALQGYLAEIGIEVEVVLLEASVWLETFKNAQDGYMVGGHGFGMNLANQMLSNFSISAADGVGMMCYSKIHPEDLDAKINEAITATDTDVMLQAVKDANKMISDEYAIAFPIWLSTAYHVIWSDAVVDEGCFNNTSVSFDYNLLRFA